MQEKINKLSNLCFWIALVIECVIVMIDKSAYTNPWEGQLFRLTFLLFCIKVITTGYSKREWIVIAIVGNDPKPSNLNVSGFVCSFVIVLGSASTVATNCPIFSGTNVNSTGEDAFGPSATLFSESEKGSFVDSALVFDLMLTSTTAGIESVLIIKNLTTFVCFRIVGAK